MTDSISATEMQDANRSIAVFGAYGHTAGFVLAELYRRGWTPVLSGRDTTKLNLVNRPDLHWNARVASIDDPASLDEAIAGTAAVINCAGPFAETAPALIDAALRAGIHYLDMTAESLVTIDTFERYGAPASDRGIAVLPSMGFFGGLGDLLATAAAEGWMSVDEIVIAVALDSWQPTRGTRLAMERREGRRVVFSDGRLAIRTTDDPVPTGDWAFPQPVGRQDVVGELSTVDAVTISHHLDTRDIHAYINLAPIKELTNPDTPTPSATDDSGRSSQTFLLDVVARRGEELCRVSARGRDIYAITAPIIVEASERLIDGRFAWPGVASAGEIFDAEDFLGALIEGQHLTIERERVHGRMPGQVSS